MTALYRIPHEMCCRDQQKMKRSSKLVRNAPNWGTIMVAAAYVALHTLPNHPNTAIAASERSCPHPLYTARARAQLVAAVLCRAVRNLYMGCIAGALDRQPPRECSYDALTSDCHANSSRLPGGVANKLTLAHLLYCEKCCEDVDTATHF